PPGRHHVADRTTRRLRRLATGGDMRRSRCRVFLRTLAQIVAIHELFVQLARAHALHHIEEVRIDGLIREQALIELPLHLFSQSGPVAAHDFHAHELHDVLARALPETRVALARATYAVPGPRQKQAQIELL